MAAVWRLFRAVEPRPRPASAVNFKRLEHEKKKEQLVLGLVSSIVADKYDIQLVALAATKEAADASHVNRL